MFYVISFLFITLCCRPSLAFLQFSLARPTVVVSQQQSYSLLQHDDLQRATSNGSSITFCRIIARTSNRNINLNYRTSTDSDSDSWNESSSNLEIDTVLKDINSIDELMQTYDPILLFARKLLPDQTAKDASALYAWCRRLDEITDDPNADAETIQKRLDIWKRRFDRICNKDPVDDMDAALMECFTRNVDLLTREPFDDMIQGMKNDAVVNRRIETMYDLEEYAYQVAGTVGVMLLPLLDAEINNAKEPAIALGKAIQLINILRDASFDVSLGRIYLPQDLLMENQVLEEDIMNRKSSEAYCNVVKQVADRANHLLRQAEEGKKSLPGFGPLFVQVIVQLYRGYLEKLESLDYDNLNVQGERVRITSLQKLGAVFKAMQKVLSYS